MNKSFGKQHVQYVYHIAKYLENQGFWSQQLPPHEKDIVAAALETPESWNQFYNFKAKINPRTNKRNKSRSKKSQASSLNRGLSLLEILNFRVRSLLFDFLTENQSIVRGGNIPRLNSVSDIFFTLEDEKEDLESSSEKKIEPIPKYKILMMGSLVPKTKSTSTQSRSTAKIYSTRQKIPNQHWVNVDQGLEELYQGLFYVLNELKNYKEHSYPFLKRVSKCDAPDYYEVIEHPMDLSQITKNLNNLSYFSKAEFQRDLDLIYSNCRKYNTDRDSIYLKHSKAMDEKSRELMKTVKDIDKTQDRERILALIKQQNLDKEMLKKQRQDEKKKETYIRSMFYIENPKRTLWKAKTIDQRSQLHSYDETQRNLPFPERDFIEDQRFPTDSSLVDPISEPPVDAKLHLRSIVNNNMKLLSRSMGFQNLEITDASSKLASAVVIDPAINLALMDQSVSIVISSHGYKGIESSALEVLSSVVVNYLTQFGKTVRSFLDVPGTTDDLSVIIDKSFAVTNPSALQSMDSFLSQDIKSNESIMDFYNVALKPEPRPAEIPELNISSVDASETSSTPSKKIDPKYLESRKQKKKDKSKVSSGSPTDTSSPAVNTRARRRTRSATIAVAQRKRNISITADLFMDNEAESENEGFEESARKKQKRTVGRKTRKKVN